VTISHEIIEMVADPMLDQYRSWGDAPDASRLSLELCDPVATWNK
jgi:hypothetical protein